MANCIQCHRALTSDEIGLHKKMINRASTEFMCITCLAAFFHCEEALLQKKIEQFRSQGCMLFVKDAPKTTT